MVHPLLADKWAGVGLQEGEFTDRADRIPVAVDPVRQGWPPSPKECSKVNTLVRRKQGRPFRSGQTLQEGTGVIAATSARGQLAEMNTRHSVGEEVGEDVHGGYGKPAENCQSYYSESDHCRSY